MAKLDRPNRFSDAAKRESSETTTSTEDQRKRKYTILLTAAMSADLEDDALTISRQVGRRVDKSDVLRALVAMLHADPTLVDEVSRHLRDQA